MDVMNLIWDNITEVIVNTGLVDATAETVRDRVQRKLPNIVTYLSVTEIFLIPLEKEYMNMSNRAIADMLESVGGIEIDDVDRISEEHRMHGYNLLRDLIEVYKIFKIKI